MMSSNDIVSFILGEIASVKQLKQAVFFSMVKERLVCLQKGKENGKWETVFNVHRLAKK